MQILLNIIFYEVRKNNSLLIEYKGKMEFTYFIDEIIKNIKFVKSILDWGRAYFERI